MLHSHKRTIAMITQPPSNTTNSSNKKELNKASTDKPCKPVLEQSNNQFKQSLDPLFNPFIRVIPEKDWSKIKAIWIPFLHHDYNNQLEKSEKITLLKPTIDKFGTVQGYLLASNENYIPYLTTFFNPVWTQDRVIEKILQAHANILETELTVTNQTNDKIIRKTVIGIARSGMLISITTNNENKIIDAFPLFHKKEES